VPLDMLRFRAAGGGVEGMAASMAPPTQLSAVSKSSAPVTQQFPFERLRPAQVT
jgi:hypothetical protein